MKKTLLLLLMLIIIGSSVVYAGEAEFENFIEKGTVLKASEVRASEYEYFRVQDVLVRIDSGPYKGKEILVQNELSDHQYYDIIVEKGNKVSLMIEEFPDGEYNVYISDYYRINQLVYLVIAFIFFVIVIGGIKGLKSLISLGITISAILFVMLPLMLRGFNPILVSVVTAIVVTIVTIVLVSGINHKSFAAIAGTSTGVIIAGLIAFYVGNKAYLSGLSAEEASMLMFIPQGIDFNFRHLLFAGIIMGALGAAMDVGMSISSSVSEIHKANPNLSRKRLFRSGMNVGKDVMGTMVNTLILAYAGSSIPMLLLFMAYETELSKVFNLDVVATEVVRSMAGSIGLILTIPLTAFVASYLIKEKKEVKIQNEIKEGEI